MTLRIEIREKPWDLVIAIVLAILLLGVILIGQKGVLLTSLGLVFILFLPGYVIISSLFPKAEELGTIERIALSFGISIAVAPLIGLMINYTSWGIRLESIFTSLIVLVVSVSIIAWYRRIQIPIEDRFYIAISLELPKGAEVTSFDKILTIIMVFSIIFAISTLIYFIAIPRIGERFTEFYILNENRTAENYPTNLTVGENGTVIVGVICREHETIKYYIEIKLINLTGERENITLRQYNLSLEHNRCNETVFNFDVSDNGTYKLQFILYINDIKEPYRELHIWLDVKP